MSDEPFITLAYAKPALAEPSSVTALMPLSWLVVGLMLSAAWMTWPAKTVCSLGAPSLTAGTMTSLSTSLDMFKMNVGRYPHRIDELLNPCSDCPDSARWKGPYLDDAVQLKDMWGSGLYYKSPGLHNKSSYDLSSPGPDHIAGTTDDITNW